MNDKEAEKIAAWKYSIIAPAISGVHGFSSETECLKAAAGKPYQNPVTGETVFFKPNTIRNWAWLYKSGGFDALKPSCRKDMGSFRSLEHDISHDLIVVAEQFPRAPKTVWRKKLIEKAVITDELSQPTFNRLVRKLDQEGKLEVLIEKKDRRAYEAAHVNDFWQADTTYLFKLGGKQLYLVLIIDDASRMVMGSGIYYQDNAVNFQKTLRDAIRKYGRPSVLYTDNGGPYANEQLDIICAKAQISHVKAPVRDGAAKGKVERCNRNIKDHWMYAVDTSQFKTIEEVRKSFESWLYREYVNQPHSALLDEAGNPVSPRQRLLCEEKPFRYFTGEQLSQIFMQQYSRKIKNDSTFTLHNIRYETDSVFAGSKITVNLNPEEPEKGTFIVEHSGEVGEYWLLDKKANMHIPRKKKVSFQNQEDDK